MPERIEFGAKPCRYYWEIGCGCCDNCGKQPRDHAGMASLRASPFAGSWVGLSWDEWDAYVERERAIREAKSAISRLPDDKAIALARLLAPESD